MNKKDAGHYSAGYDTAPEFEILQHHPWLYCYDLSYDYEKHIDIESPLSRTKNIYAVMDLFSRLAGNINRHELDWLSIVEKDEKGLNKYHHHVLIGKSGLDPCSSYQKQLLQDVWQNIYREKWYDEWLERTCKIPNKIRNKTLREKYNYFNNDRDGYLGKNHRSPPFAFNILGENTFMDRKYRKFPFNGTGQASVEVYDKEQFCTNGVGYRMKRQKDLETNKPKVDLDHPVEPDMSPHLKRYLLNKRRFVISEIDHRQKFFSTKEPGALHPFKLYNIIPSNPGFDLKIIGLSAGQCAY
jgi:hypothetical protein